MKRLWAALFFQFAPQVMSFLIFTVIVRRYDVPEIAAYVYALNLYFLIMPGLNPAFDQIVQVRLKDKSQTAGAVLSSTALVVLAISVLFSIATVVYLHFSASNLEFLKNLLGVHSGTDFDPIYRHRSTFSRDGRLLVAYPDFHRQHPGWRYGPNHIGIDASEYCVDCTVVLRRSIGYVCVFCTALFVAHGYDILFPTSRFSFERAGATGTAAGEPCLSGSDVRTGADLGVGANFERCRFRKIRHRLAISGSHAFRWKLPVLCYWSFARTSRNWFNRIYATIKSAFSLVLDRQCLFFLIQFRICGIHCRACFRLKGRRRGASSSNSCPDRADANPHEFSEHDRAPNSRLYSPALGPAYQFCTIGSDDVVDCPAIRWIRRGGLPVTGACRVRLPHVAPRTRNAPTPSRFGEVWVGPGRMAGICWALSVATFAAELLGCPVNSVQDAVRLAERDLRDIENI